MRIGTVGVLVAALAVSFLATTAEQVQDDLEEIVIKATKPPPIEDFVEFPRFDSVAVSPGGTRLAMGWTEDNFQRHLNLVSFPAMKPLNNYLLQRFLGVADIRWVTERRLLVQPDYPLRGLRRLRKPLGSLLISDLERPKLLEINKAALLDWDPLAEQRRQEARANRKSAKQPGSTPASKNAEKDAQGPVRLIAARTREPEISLFQTTRTDLAGDTDGYGAFTLNVQSGQQSRVAMLPLADGQFVTGPDSLVSLVTGTNAQNEKVVYYLPATARSEGKNWQLAVQSPAGERSLTPVAWTGKGEEYYALDGRNSPTRSVVIWNAETNTTRQLFRHPAADVENFALDPSGTPWVFSGVYNFPFYWYPDPTHPLAKLHRQLLQRLPHEHVDIMNATDDLSTAVVRVSSGKRTPVFIVMDVQSGKSLTGMQAHPKLRGSRLAKVDAIEFFARDGLQLHGYLTTPGDGDGKPRRSLPLVVITHLGPEGGATDFSYELERQLFASRGYAVLQVNARGSTGAGNALERAGDGKWGREVQDDLADGVRWAIRDGVAAEGHVCIYGAGYGAFSAMTTAARDPKLYQCVIGVAGFYNLPALLPGPEKRMPCSVPSVTPWTNCAHDHPSTTPGPSRPRYC